MEGGLSALEISAVKSWIDQGAKGDAGQTSEVKAPTSNALAALELGAAGVGDTARKDAPLADAVQRRDKPAVQSLLKKKADVNAPQSDGATES